jgi:hypothetical protein
MATTRKAAAGTTVINFIFSNETKGTRRYSEDADDPKIGTIYLKKAFAAEIGNPESFTVTITPAAV